MEKYVLTRRHDPSDKLIYRPRELQELDRRLFDKRRHDGTACVLIHGQPGAGKSHLARQYVNKNRKKFIGGVFWIVSHLKEEIDQAFETIYQKTVARESSDASSKLSKGERSFVKSVKAWFESRQDWLIVFDGVTVETDADVTELSNFVPDSKNCSLIYVSRQRNLESKQRLLRPHAIRVPVLKVDDARKLLLKELHIKKPTEDQIKHASKLVKQVDCLPLAIDAISHRIADTHEPLIRYSMKSYSTNPKLEGTYNQILDDMQRLDHMEAWNLIHILAFYGQHVPVEMIHLGTKDFQDVPVKSSEGMGAPDLNVTLGILMRHALLERNEPESDTSSSRDSLVEPEPIDMLKIKKQSLAPIRADLEPLLETIENQISSLEPGSSQESVNKVYQVSIFDRTTSSSDSVPSAPSTNEARTPSHRPSPLPLAHETLWGTDARKPSLESPASIGSARTPRIVGHSPHQGYYDDFGYESDREVSHYTSQPMRKNLSETTQRPYTRELEDQEDGWQVVLSNKRIKKPRIGRDLGTFRPTPARATRAEVDRRSATGTLSRSSDRTKNRSSEAKAALSKVHSRSPSPSLQNRTENVTSFWQRRPLASQTNSQRTWANVAAGYAHRPRVQPIPPTPVPAIIPPSATPQSASSRYGNPFSSPLASEIRQDENQGRDSLANSADFSMGSSYEISPRTQQNPTFYPTPPPGYSPSLTQPRYMNCGNLHYPPQVAGPNPAQLPYDNIDDNISNSSKRRLPDEFRNDSQPLPYPPSFGSHGESHSSHTSPYPPYEAYYPISTLPAGYSSQPMSRDNSHQSRISAAETEPLHYPPFTSHNGGGFVIEPPSPRDRFPDGRPLRKSPRSEQGFPISSNRTSPHDLSKSLPGLGGWTYQRDDPRPMSRSSSGPGVAIEGTSGHGLGIVPFDGHLRFGDHNPISVEEARQRTYEWESRLARRGRVVTHPDEAPYPDVNLIPTQSNPEAMREMAG
ncbi:MAG: hypothetical protein Q9219_004300 [cf. Caloplaca sp. 3 TL-2023]